MSFELQGIAPCNGIQDSLRFWIPRRGFWILSTGFHTLSVELGFRIPIVSGIPYSLTCIQDSTSKIPQFRIPRAKIFSDSLTCVDKLVDIDYPLQFYFLELQSSSTKQKREGVKVRPLLKKDLDFRLPQQTANARLELAIS